VSAPPEWAFGALASVIRRELGLTLFNFDVVVPSGQEQEQPLLLHLLDINYFPGYEKLAGYENLMVGFYREVLAGVQEL
jgi:inositol-1,3,4-trisphosphate 5/6-kinase / inositol-tetrakisphosphate 1-kinase